MKIDAYIESAQKLTLSQFLALDEDTAIRFDFLTQGDEPDRCALSREIYQKLYSWYDDSLHAGDTMNTYRTAIIQFYGEAYRNLPRVT